MTKDEIINEIRAHCEKFEELGGVYIDQSAINTQGQIMRRFIIEYVNEID